MENKYTKLFDEVHASQRLKTEVLNMKNTQERTANRRRVPAAALAACLCLALVGTGFAVNVISGFTEARTIYVERENSEDLDVKTVSGYTIDISDRVYFPRPALSDEARNRDSSHVGFDSWRDAEEYLGLDIADNPVLEQAAGGTSFNGIDYYRCFVNFYGSVKEPTIVELYAIHFFAPGGVELGTLPNGIPGIYADPDEPLIEVATMAHAYMEDYDKAWERPVTRYFANGGEVLQENYVTPSGLETVIFTIPCVNGSRAGSTDYEVYFTLNGVEFNLKVRDYSETSDPEFAMATLKEILDAYS